ncbi:MAG: ATP-binding protein [Candidatus Woesearchaeota archaeon]
MELTFTGRNEELDYLNKEAKDDSFKMFPIYGRRRVGKTRLVKEFLKNKNGLYLLSKETSIQENLKRISKDIKSKFNLDYNLNFETFEDLFEFLKDKEKLIIAIDEFPYLVRLDKSIPSRFQYIIDEILKETNHKLLLIGSSISMMEKHLLSYKSPLYGRRSGQIKLEPLEFSYMKELFPNQSSKNLAKVYGITGGVPSYLESLNSIKFDKVIKQVLNKKSIFFEEVDFLLREELKEPKNYRLILTSIASGKTKFTDISNDTNIDRTSLTKYFSILINLGFIEKKTPLLSSRNTKKTYYQIKDNFIDFSFRFIEEYRKEIVFENETFFKEFKERYNTYMGEVYEKIAKQFLEKKYKRNFSKQWGTYRVKKNNRAYEIDLMNASKDKVIAYEIKWKKLSDNDIKRITDKYQKILKKITKQKEIEIGIIAKSFENKKDNFYDIKDIITQ